MEENLFKLFTWLHAHPELSFQERETTRMLRETLEREGVEILPSALETGFVARVKGSRPGRVIALRCDIDALPITEETDLPYASQHPGCMHACGHDFHSAVMAGAALRLQQQREAMAGEVKIIFQPGEETAHGADQVVETGLVADAACFLGIHSYPGFPSGTLGIKEGPVMAAVDRFQVNLQGRGAHAAQPQKGVDPIPVMAALIQQLQTLVSRTIDPFSPAVVSVTHVSGGNTWNVIPETAFLEGTVRTLRPEDRERLHQGIRQMAAHVAQASGATAQVEWIPGPPAVVNDAQLCRLARQLAIARGFQVAQQEDTLGGEDFSCYLENRPGLFLRVGTGGGIPSHHPKFFVDPGALEPAADYFAALALACLA